MKSIAGFATFAAVAATAVPANAAISLADAFATPGFTFGIGTGGAGFTAFANSYTSCFGSPDFRCATNAGNNTVPVIGKYSGAGSYSFGTPNVPNNLLFLHPGPNAGEDAILRFTASASQTYSLTGGFVRVDASNGSGNGVQGSVYATTGGVTSQLFTGTVTPTSYLNNAFFNNVRVTLNPGDTLDFVVNSRGDFNYDSTGLGGVILAVPEPAQWALLISGFGVIGGVARSRRRQRVSVSFQAG